jgi:hypothetical protein
MGDRVQTEISDRDLAKWVIGLGRNPQLNVAVDKLVYVRRHAAARQFI